MPSPKPTGSYAQQLAEEIKEWHEKQLTKGKRHTRGGSDGDRPITNEWLANVSGIDAKEWNKILNNKARLSKESIFRLVSMPWVTNQCAKRWVLLWLANELDDFHNLSTDEHIAPSALKSYSRTGKLDHVADFLVSLANYVPTLGVIDQIHSERTKANQNIPEASRHLPEEGPLILGGDVDRKSVDGLLPVIREYRTKRPLDTLTRWFAKLLIRQELKEREEELRGHTNKELA